MKKKVQETPPKKTLSLEEPLSDYRRKVLWEVYLPTGDISLATLSAKRAIKYLTEEGYIKEWKAAGVDSLLLTPRGRATLGVAGETLKQVKGKRVTKQKASLPEGAIEVNSREGIPLGYLVPEADDFFGTVYNVWVYNKDKQAEPHGLSTKLEMATAKVLGTYNKKHLTSYNKAPMGHKKNLNESQVSLATT